MFGHGVPVCRRCQLLKLVFVHWTELNWKWRLHWIERHVWGGRWIHLGQVAKVGWLAWDRSSLAYTHKSSCGMQPHVLTSLYTYFYTGYTAPLSNQPIHIHPMGYASALSHQPMHIIHDGVYRWRRCLEPLLTVRGFGAPPTNIDRARGVIGIIINWMNLMARGVWVIKFRKNILMCASHTQHIHLPTLP